MTRVRAHPRSARSPVASTLISGGADLTVTNRPEVGSTVNRTLPPVPVGANQR